MAMLFGLGLLLAFYLVVSRSVANAEQRQTALDAQAEGTWRCKLLHNVADRAGCLARTAGMQDAVVP